MGAQAWSHMLVNPFPGGRLLSQHVDGGQKCWLWRCWFLRRQEGDCPSTGEQRFGVLQEYPHESPIIHIKPLPSSVFSVADSLVSSSAHPQLEPRALCSLHSCCVLLYGHPEYWPHCSCHLVQASPSGFSEAAASTATRCITDAFPYIWGSLSLDLWAVSTFVLMNLKRGQL